MLLLFPFASRVKRAITLRDRNSTKHTNHDGSDFTDVTGTLTFDEDNATQTISVPITGDTSAEKSEFFNVSLRDATGGAVITDDLALGTIQNDDQEAVTQSDRFLMQSLQVDKGFSRMWPAQRGREANPLGLHRFFTPDVDASFYTPSASERAEILDIIPELELDGADGIAFLLEPTPET